MFALLDQRNTECHWATVQALAARKGRRKIELLYFMGVSWLHRSLRSSSTEKRLAEIDRWWGGAGWRDILNQSQNDIMEAMAQRFHLELGYEFVRSYPIFQREKGEKKAFYLIHASDHPDAGKLMTRAFKKVVGDVAGAPGDSQMHMADGDEEAWPEQREKPD